MNAEIRDLLPDMLHNNLSAADRKRVSQHLTTCDACKDELQLLEQVAALSPHVIVNSGAIAAAITPYRPRRSFVLHPAMRIAASIVVVALGAGSYSLANKALQNDGRSVAESTLALLGSRTDSSRPVAYTVAESTTVAADIATLDDQAMADLLARIEGLETEIREDARPIVRNPTEGGME